MHNQSIVINHFGGPEVVQVVTNPRLPEPGTGQVRVSVEASSVVFSDTLIRKGIYPYLKQKPPFALGYDCIGIVDQLGAGVTHLQVGQRVAALTQIGSNVTYAILPAHDLVTVPATVDPAEAEAMILSYMTAHQMLKRSAQIMPGQRVLIHGGSGAVGMALLELGRQLALDMITTTSHRHAGLLQAYGATILDYQASDYPHRLRASAQGGFDAIFDGVGLANFIRSFRLLKPGGTLVPYGFVQPAKIVQQRSVTTQLAGGLMFLASLAALHTLSALPGGRIVKFYDINETRQQHPEWFSEDLHDLFNGLASGRLKPQIARRFPLAEAAQAHALLDSGAVRGRIVLVTPS